MTDIDAGLASVSFTVNVTVPAASLTSNGPLIFAIGTAPSIIVPVPVTTVGFDEVLATKDKLSFPSITPSLNVPTRTITLDMPAGTCTEPESGTNVTPPSTDTN